MKEVSDTLLAAVQRVRGLENALCDNKGPNGELYKIAEVGAKQALCVWHEGRLLAKIKKYPCKTREQLAVLRAKLNQEIVEMKKAGCYDHLTPAISSFVKAADLWRPIKGADLVSQQEKEAKEKEDAKAGAEKSDSEEEEAVTAPVRKRKAPASEEDA